LNDLLPVILTKYKKSPVSPSVLICVEK